MANPEHLAKLKEGVAAWNDWRKQDGYQTQPDLSEADLTGLNLNDAEFQGTNLSRAVLVDVTLGRANFIRANLYKATFSLPPPLYDSVLREVNLSDVDLTQVSFEGKDLTAANFNGSSLRRSDLSKSTLLFAQLEGADLRDAHMNGADLRGANLSRADLRGASLQRVNLIQTNLTGADLTGCRIYCVSAWDLNLEGTHQSNLIITPNGESPIQVDNLKVAQFIYLLLNNERIRNVIDTITSKVVLILGRFAPERKVVLDAIRDELRRRDYLPVLFDFEKPSNKDLTGTISTLANMARSQNRLQPLFYSPCHYPR